MLTKMTDQRKGAAFRAAAPWRWDLFQVIKETDGNARTVTVPIQPPHDKIQLDWKANICSILELAL